MNFNKCIRCGCFFTSNSEVCPHCSPKDTFELSKLKGYLEETSLKNGSIQEICLTTGISVKNLNRYLNSTELEGMLVNSGNETGNISINL